MLARRWLTIAALAGPSAAAADPIVDRNYAIDVYDGVAIGDTSQVGMGGAGAARVVGSAGTLLNASAPAVRPTTDNDWFSWDYHLDALTGKYSSDYDNNGVTAADGSGASLVTLGFALRFGNWAGAATLTAQTAPIDGSMSPALETSALRHKLAFAYLLQSYDLAIGGGVQTVQFDVSQVGGDTMFAISGAGGLVGMTWLPRLASWRVGLAYEGEIHGGDVKSSNCDPLDCQGYILPERIESPARLIGGFAYRWAPTAWNQLVKTPFRDELSLTVAVDVVATGASPDGNGLEAFGMQQLQPSGRDPVVSLRGGLEVEPLPGRLRLRAGSYWEPARFVDVGGRVHGTFGLDLRVFEFDLFGRRRGRVSATGDLAPRYRNVALSIGFWH